MQTAKAVQETSPTSLANSLSPEDDSIDDIHSLGIGSPTSSGKKDSLMTKLKQRLTPSKLHVPRNTGPPSPGWRRQTKGSQWAPRPPPVPPEGAELDGESPLASAVPKLETPKLLRSQLYDESTASAASFTETTVPQPPKLVRYPTITSPKVYENPTPATGKLDPRESLREVNPRERSTIAEQMQQMQPQAMAMPSALPVFPRALSSSSRTSDSRDQPPRGILHCRGNTKHQLRRSLPNIPLSPQPPDSNLKRVRFSNGSINDVTVSVWEIEHDAAEFEDVNERPKQSAQLTNDQDESNSESEVWSNDACDLTDGYRSKSLPRDFSPGPKLMDSHLTCSTIDDICNLTPPGAVEELVCLDIDALD